MSPERTSHICNDKLLTCRHLRAHGIRAAETYLPQRPAGGPAVSAVHQAAIRPRRRWCACRFTPPSDLAFFVEYIENPVVQEYLDGPEFTIDVLCDFRHRPISIVPRERVVVRAGVIDRGRTVHDRKLIELAKSVTQALPFTGAVNIQCRVRRMASPSCSRSTRGSPAAFR